jgi:hypothetical protein
MATNSMTSRPSARSRRIPVRRIGQDDLRFALKAGWDDFLDMRGDIFIAGLV